MVPSIDVETIFLDAGGVLVLPNWDRVSVVLARHGLRAPVSELRRVEPAVKFSIDRALGLAESTDERRNIRYFEGVLDAVGVDESGPRLQALGEVRAYHAAHNLWEDVPSEVVPALERLRASGRKLAVASNANGSLHRAFDRLGLTGYFAAICDSFVEGVEKPDPRFFHAVLDQAGSRAATTLHVGDLYHVDVIGARRAGLHAVLLDRDDLYGAYDVVRVASLAELADALA